MNTEKTDTTSKLGELIIYPGEGGKAPVQVRLEGETVWLTQRQMAALYQVRVPTINEHITNIYAEGELSQGATIRKFLIVQQEGTRQVQRSVDHYNLEAIIAVGFRVRSKCGVQFRKWANERISEFLVKGFTMDDERLKHNISVTDYFDELLARIRDIRASEARVYLMIRNIFALAVDYRADDTATREFFAIMQNKMLYAATGLVATEIVLKRANAQLPNMGLQSWKGNKVRKADVGVAKNYLKEKEIETLNRITVMFLDQAEFRAQRRKVLHMRDWGDFLDHFIQELELPVLTRTPAIRHQDAIDFSDAQYEQFEERRRAQALDEAEADYVLELTSSVKRLSQEERNG